ncbi:restriction endonuclease subunit S [Gardnerella vaginalis]|uniref:restriction endonuclease subunit S n=1 Tax=Gardnerella vaginalis TaxID=2702 RepID=UPI003970FCE6
MKFDGNSLYNIKSNFDGFRCSLFDLATWKNGLSFKKIDFSDTGLPVIKIAELNNGINSNTSFTKGNYGEDVFIRRDDILFSWSGNPKTSIDVFRYRLENGWLNQHIFKVTANEDFVTKDFLYYALKFLKPHFTQIATNKQTTGLGHVTISDLKRVSLIIPSKSVQNKIVSILKTIDSKIENNRAINKNLEEQAQAIFKAWFIDFEPFDEKMPANWIVSKLGDIASIKTNSFSPVKNPDAQLEHYSIPAYDEQKYPVFESAEGVKSNKYILSKNSVMISKLNPDTKRAWRPMCLSNLAVSSTEFIIFEAFNPAYKDFVFSIIDSASFSDWMCAHTTGSTNSRQRTTPSATLEFQVALPDEKTITDFCATVTPMYDTISANICENQKLAQLRDSILPKLMSGELDVSNIDL